MLREEASRTFWEEVIKQNAIMIQRAADMFYICSSRLGMTLEVIEAEVEEVPSSMP